MNREDRHVSEQDANNEDVIWVLIDSPPDGDIQAYAGPGQINADKLREHFQSFTTAMAQALEGLKSPVKDFQLSEVAIQAKLTGEIGFVLVGKTGVEGGVEFRYARKGT
jgi:hypothetical protein